MAWAGGEKIRELEGVLHEAAGRLSPAHVAALAAHPDAVRSALAVAADVLRLDDEARSGVETIASAEPVRAGAEDGRLRTPYCTRPMAVDARQIEPHPLVGCVSFRPLSPPPPWQCHGMIVRRRGEIATGVTPFQWTVEGCGHQH